MIELRPVKENDGLFIESVYRSTREAELNITQWSELQKNSFIIMQSMAQLAAYRTKFPEAVYQVIVFNKEDAGRFYTWENENEIRLIDITLLPKFRGKGIGSTLLKELIKKSNKVQKKISLHVEPTNTALHLYGRLGFIHINTNGHHYYMEKNPEDF